MQPADIAHSVSVAAPTLSPDDLRVAFVVTRTDLDATATAARCGSPTSTGLGRRTR